MTDPFSLTDRSLHSHQFVPVSNGAPGTGRALAVAGRSLGRRESRVAKLKLL